jgi:AcrR family transcriptional regulator
MADTLITPTSPESRPMRADARRNYERILAVAHTVFAENGAQASLEEIARRADVGIGTLYRHFPSREDLFAAVMRTVFEGQHAEALRQMAHPDPVAGFEAYVQYWFQHTAPYKGLAAELMTAALKSERSWVASCEVAWEDSDVLLKRAQESGQYRKDVSAKDVWRLLHGVAITLHDGSMSLEDAQPLLDVVMRGLRA